MSQEIVYRARGPIRKGDALVLNTDSTVSAALPASGSPKSMIDALVEALERPIEDEGFCVACRAHTHDEEGVTYKHQDDCPLPLAAPKRHKFGHPPSWDEE